MRVIIESGLLASLLVLLLALPLEYIRPIQSVPILNKLRTALCGSFAFVIGASAKASLILGINALGNGPLVLPGGEWLPLSCAGYIVLADMARYWRHRMEHSVPFLWALHSFHHADRELNTFAALNAYWLSKVFQIELILLALIVKAPPEAIIAGTLFQMTAGVFIHLNLRVSFGPLTAAFIGPQFHRIHHSLDPEHHDRNFSDWAANLGCAFRDRMDTDAR